MLVENLRKFYLAGGSDLHFGDADDSNDEGGDENRDGNAGVLENLATNILQLLDECVNLSPLLGMTMSTFSDANSVIHWHRAESRFWSGRLGFAEASVLTGPPGCGRSKLLVRTSLVLGTNFDNYGCSLPQQYFTSEDKRGANDSQPALAKCRNKRFITTKELRGTAGIRPHTLKNM